MNENLHIVRLPIFSSWQHVVSIQIFLKYLHINVQMNMARPLYSSVFIRTWNCYLSLAFLNFFMEIKPGLFLIFWIFKRTLRSLSRKCFFQIILEMQSRQLTFYKRFFTRMVISFIEAQRSYIFSTNEPQTSQSILIRNPSVRNFSFVYELSKISI